MTVIKESGLSRPPARPRGNCDEGVVLSDKAVCALVARAGGCLASRSVRGRLEDALNAFVHEVFRVIARKFDDMPGRRNEESDDEGFFRPSGDAAYWS